jgi:hypothetical protein
MRTLTTMTLVAMAMVLAAAGPSLAQGMAGSVHHDGGGHHESDGYHHGDRDGHHEDGRTHFRGGQFIYWNYPTYVAPTAGYWYYCPSAEAYYPYVTYCLDTWVPVRAQ